MRGLTEKFASLRRNIRKGNKDICLEKLNDLQKTVEDKLLTLNKCIEVGKKECCPIEDRFLDIQDAEGSTHRLTINAFSGRFTLKISKKASEKVARELEKFALILMQNTKDLPPVTLRGKITFNTGLGHYEWYGQSESKKFKVYLKGE